MRLSRKNIEKCEKALDELCEKYEYSLSDIKSRSRKAFIVEERRHVVRLLYKRGYSMNIIGHTINRDPSSVYNLIRNE